MERMLDALEFGMTSLGVCVGGLIGFVIVRITVEWAWNAICIKFARAAKQVRCSVFLKTGKTRGFVGAFWLPAVPRVGEKMVIPELMNPHDDKTHKMNGWLGGRVTKVEYAIEGGVPWHTNIHVDCESVAVWD